MRYRTLFVALLLGGVAASPTNSNPSCKDGVCGGECGDSKVQRPLDECITSPNNCDITAPCSKTPGGKTFCGCRPGYRADGLLPTDQRQFRLKFPGQEYRVFVAPGIVCNTLCTEDFPEPDSCREVCEGGLIGD